MQHLALATERCLWSQNYFTKILEDELKAIIKPQYVDQVQLYTVQPSE